MDKDIAITMSLIFIGISILFISIAWDKRISFLVARWIGKVMAVTMLILSISLLVLTIIYPY